MATYKIYNDYNTITLNNSVFNSKIKIYTFLLKFKIMQKII